MGLASQESQAADALADSPVVLQVVKYSKRFSHVQANQEVDLEVKRGEIHCLLGENGAGKSTLAKCLYGSYRPDSGKLYILGQPVEVASPRDAIKWGIGMVHQHFVLAPPMTVVENIIVGTASVGVMVNLAEASQKIKTLCHTYGIDLDPGAKVRDLSVGQQQWVEILKALYVGVCILILDEPTAALTPQEVEQLFALLRQMTQDGMAVILITHRLEEVIQVSDRVTVMRRGQVVATTRTSALTKEELARLMVGREVSFQVEKDALTPGAAALEAGDLWALKENGRPALQGLSLAVRRHEILGLAGVGGNGQDELFDVIVGVRRVERGRLALAGEEVQALSPNARFALGLATVPQDRLKQGLLLGFTIEENLILGMQRRPPFTRGLFFNRRAIEDFARRSIRDYEIKTAGPRQVARQLSGGNLQKVILAREFSREIKCLVASSPTRGLDVGATEYVHQRLIDLRSQGAGILLISEDLDEIFKVSDRIAVIFKGQIVGVLPAAEADLAAVGLLMAGVKGSEA